MKNRVFANKDEVKCDLIREDRLNSGLDQESVGDVLGLNASTISGWESNKRTPKIAHLISFAELMGKNPERYVEGEALRQVKFFIARTRAVRDFATN